MNVTPESILKALQAVPGGATIPELMSRMSVPRTQKGTMRRVVKQMISEGQIRRGPHGTVRAGGREDGRRGSGGVGVGESPRRDDDDALISGTLSRHPDGYGFVAPLKGGGPDLFIPPDGMGSALHGDVVMAEVTQVRGDRRAGRIVGVERRRLAGIAGRFEVRGKAAFVIPDDRRHGGEIYVAKNDWKEARHGQVVLVEIIAPPSADFFAKGRIIKILGERSDPTVDSQIVLEELGISPEFGLPTLRMVGAFARGISASERERRRDLTHIPFVTIDGSTAKDFDDAVALIPRPGRVMRLYVAIADVAHFVTQGSPLDAEARARGTSVYLPDLVVPMLPEKLSNDLCSLRPNEERLALCCAMDIDATGRVIAYGIDRAVIRSRERMIYEDVEMLLTEADSRLATRYDQLVPSFLAMRDLAKTLFARRSAQGTIDFEIPEARVVLDEHGATKDIVRVKRLMSHRLIEEFMLTANVTVARHLAGYGVPAIYRIHPEPSQEKIETFHETLRVYGVGPGKHALDSPGAFGVLLKRFQDRPEKRLINTLLLRSMSQAKYAVDNIGHFGLGFSCYTHFTSPIRRYPDLLVHRQLHVLLERGVDGLRRWTQEYSGDIGAAADSSSRAERLAMEAERDSVMLKKIRFMQERLGQEFDGHVSGVARAGVFVEINDFFVDGLVSTDALGDDAFEYDERSHAVVGRRSRQTFRLGDPIRVQVSRASLEERRIDFVRVSDQEPRGRRARR